MAKFPKNFRSTSEEAIAGRDFFDSGLLSWTKSVDFLGRIGSMEFSRKTPADCALELFSALKIVSVDGFRNRKLSVPGTLGHSIVLRTGRSILKR